ncbi:hypothetical protein BE11_38620 [Sorangium cellulosum]|nr:hypothetical protein BE11_38620 [Sorangium cellulosum]
MAAIDDSPAPSCCCAVDFATTRRSSIRAAPEGPPIVSGIIPSSAVSSVLVASPIQSQSLLQSRPP